MRIERRESADDGARGGDARLERALKVAAAALAVAILLGTAYGLATGSRGKKLAREAEAALAAPALAEGSAVFKGLGTVRASTRDEPKAVVVAPLSFPYPASERAFREELARKAPALKAAAVAYLSRRSAAELHPAYEGAVKAGLRDALNELLSLGKVEELWMSDFAVIK